MNISAANQPLSDGLANNKVLDTIYSRKVVVANQLNREIMLLQIKVDLQSTTPITNRSWNWPVSMPFVALAGEGNRPTPAQMELQLVQSKTDIETPPNIYNAVAL